MLIFRFSPEQLRVLGQLLRQIDHYLLKHHAFQDLDQKHGLGKEVRDKTEDDVEAFYYFVFQLFVDVEGHIQELGQLPAKQLINTFDYGFEFVVILILQFSVVHVLVFFCVAL